MTLHKYLYTHGNPVSNIDPSGNFSLASARATVGGIISRLSSALSRVSGVARGVLRALRKKKVFQIYLGVGRGAASGRFRNIFGHAFIYAKNIRFKSAGLTGSKGLLYDANPDMANLTRQQTRELLGGGPARSLGVSGLVQVRATSYLNIRRQMRGRTVGPGIKLSLVQWLFWRSSVRGFTADLTYKYYSVPGGETVSCYTWAAEAYAKAVVAKVIKL